MSQGHALVIGGSRGIGAEVAALGRLRGWSLSVLSRAKAPKPLPGVGYYRADLQDPRAALKQALRAVAASGPLDALIFCQRHRGAGDPWAAELAVSLTATQALIEGLASRFARSGGSIVVVGSLADRLVADEQQAGYHAAKAALRQLARYHAAALAPRLRVNTVTPGLVLKDEARDYYRKHAKLRRLYERATPLGRLGSPRDVAEAIWFLCSPQASFITGQDLVVDGGLSLLYQPALARRLEKA